MKSLINYIQERLIINQNYKNEIQFNKGLVIIITRYHNRSNNKIELEFDVFKTKIKECDNNKFVVKNNKLLKSFEIYSINDENLELERIDDTVLYFYEHDLFLERNIFVIHEDDEHIYKFLDFCLEKSNSKSIDNVFFSADEILNELNIDSKYMKLSNNDNNEQTIKMTYTTTVIKRVMRKLSKETVV